MQNALLDQMHGNDSVSWTACWACLWICKLSVQRFGCMSSCMLLQLIICSHLCTVVMQLHKCAGWLMALHYTMAIAAYPLL